MRQLRFYQDIELGPGELELDQRVSHHLVTVLRTKPGSEYSLFNGNGFEYKAKLLNNNKKRARVLVFDKFAPNTESPLYTHIAQCVSRGERMDYMVQKSTELGVSEITPILSERVIVKLSKKRWHKKNQHWQNIAISAAEQSFRVKIPKINPPIALSDFVSSNRAFSKFVLDTEAQIKLQSHLLTGNELSLLIGPEGGMSSTEINTATKNGFKRIGLGPRVLRTETVAPVCLGIIQSVWGDLN